jgi:hypothetical protein
MSLPPEPTFEELYAVGEFFRGTFIELMTPQVINIDATLTVEVPYEDGLMILDMARGEDLKKAEDEAEAYLGDLRDVAYEVGLALKELETKYQILGYGVKLDIRAEDSGGTCNPSVSTPIDNCE